MAFRELKPAEHPEWDGLVEASPTGTLFHSSPWLRALGGPYRLFGFFENGNLTAGITLFEHRAMGVRVARGAALTPYTGVVTPVEKGKRAHIASSRKSFFRESARFLKDRYPIGGLDLSPGVYDIQPFQWAGFSPRVRYTYILDTSDIERCWSNLHTTRRSGIRKAEREGLTAARESDPGVLIQMVRKSYARQGREASFAKSIEVLFRRFTHDRLGVFVARDAANEPVAAVLIVWDDTRGYYLAGGYDHESEVNNGIELALWTGIRWTGLERGLDEFDFEGSSVPSIERFFRKFGGELVPRFDVRWARPMLRAPVALWSAARAWKRRSD